MTLPIEPGSILADKFRVERVLGRGGMGVVVAARHLKLDEDVAVKFLLPEALESAELLARFEREARTAFRIRSEHVARVIDVGLLDSGAPYIVMEYLTGRDLGEVLRQEGPLELERAAEYLLQAGEALAEAHGLGIVHRDLKPSNLFLTQRPDGSDCVKVIDFGISKATRNRDGEALGMTHSLTVLGSPLYMSPEQLESSRSVDARSDIWAFGVSLFELLTGAHPFRAENLPQLCRLVASVPPASVLELRPELPKAVDSLIRRCLAKDPADRFQTISAFARELEPFAPRRARTSVQRIERLTLLAESSKPDAEPASTVDPIAATLRGAPLEAASTFTEFGRTNRTVRSAVRLPWVLAGLSIAVAGGFVVFASRVLREERPPPLELQAHGAVPLPPLRSVELAPTTPTPAISASPVVANSALTATQLPSASAALPPRPAKAASPARRAPGLAGGTRGPLPASPMGGRL